MEPDFFKSSPPISPVSGVLPHDEYSRSIENLEIVAFRDAKAPELIIARHDEHDNFVQEIILSAQEVSALLTHLTDPRTQAVFRPL
jgi:hypothetical protein